jgi:hypothetical protein
LGGETRPRGPDLECGSIGTEMVLNSILGGSVLTGRGRLHGALVQVVRCRVTYGGMHRAVGLKRLGGMAHRRIVKRPLWGVYRWLRSRSSGMVIELLTAKLK